MKYTVFKFENGLGEIWYQVRLKEWIFYSWIQENYRSGREQRRFKTEEECRKYIESEKEYLRKETLRKQIKITELP